MPVLQLDPNQLAFPPTELAEPNGLLALGGDLSPERLCAAYRLGIFPWYGEEDPILWWSPSPRLVLFPDRFHLPRRLARTIRVKDMHITSDQAFSQVITACAATPRKEANGTWITGAMQEAYCRLHAMGIAHSIECWLDGDLLGGLYGILLGQVFFGESMFSRVRDASKIALAVLVDCAVAGNIGLIDCQMTTRHLLGFGARELSRPRFEQLLHRLIPGQSVWAKGLPILSRTHRHDLVNRLYCSRSNS